MLGDDCLLVCWRNPVEKGESVEEKKSLRAKQLMGKRVEDMGACGQCACTAGTVWLMPPKLLVASLIYSLILQSLINHQMLLFVHPILSITFAA